MSRIGLKFSQMILHTSTSKMMNNLPFLLVVLHKPTLWPSTFKLCAFSRSHFLTDFFWMLHYTVIYMYDFGDAAPSIVQGTGSDLYLILLFEGMVGGRFVPPSNKRMTQIAASAGGRKKNSHRSCGPPVRTHLHTANQSYMIWIWMTCVFGIRIRMRVDLLFLL